jgi:hypothetical protein
MRELIRSMWSVSIDSVYFWNDVSYDLYKWFYER